MVPQARVKGAQIVFMHTIAILLNRAKEIFQTEGLISLLRRGFPFLIRQYFFRYRTVYLYEYKLGERNEADYRPIIQNFTFKIVSTNQQADELAVIGADFRSYFSNARRSLDKGAIAFCIFVGQEIAHVSWVAMTEEAKNTFDSLPYQIDFLNNEACTGGTVTITKYKGKGLMTYINYKKSQFLWEKGIITLRNAVETSNIASQKAYAKFGPKIYAKARYLEILWWKSWKETPLARTGNHD